MTKRIAIIGAGWYGCHLTNLLSKLSFDVTLYEMGQSIFSGASGSNQNRLHQGYHYPRSHRTRIQSRDGYIRFIERYPTLSKPIDNNFYVIPHFRSNMDFQTYKIVMASAGLEFSDVTEKVNFLNNVEGVLQCEERLILTDVAKEYFNQKLSQFCVFNRKVELEEIQSNNIDGQSYDFIIDCTWGWLNKIDRDTFYEKTLLLKYKRKPYSTYDTALTFVDGQLFSLFPTQTQDIFTLTHVLHTPLSREKKIFHSDYHVDEKIINTKRILMEQDIQFYFKSFLNEFEFNSFEISTKTKVNDASDDRSCYIEQDGKVIKVLSGKIDTIFYASEKILSIIA